ncbi:hypothetical protein L1999_16125 [Neobacillus drentensis]|uniref:hypothetical protein n=1 Tax=Neobacillus drentensis TaxID=220684 RepID=UPI001F3A933E|nr:hypothetical protein [Neobacillus drentensis]ULT54678.1 hypothetical protein L1999_16125 [Neobacillus drentensis]
MRMWEDFDKNEISLLIILVVAYTAYFLLNRRVNRQVRILGLLWGITIGILFDFTIGGGLLDFYRINDSNHYEVSDIFYYLDFGPFGFFFVYFYERLHIHKKTFIYFTVGGALVGVGTQWLFTWLDIITLQKGYHLVYSFPVFLVVLTATGVFFEQVRKREQVIVKS